MIFISYRVADAEDQAGHLASYLSKEFGENLVFFDKTRLSGSQDWPLEIRNRVQDCHVMLVVIGPRWQTEPFDSGKLKGFPRLHDPKDWVRQEVKLALDTGKTIIPVMLYDTKVPDSDWLEQVGLRDLSARQGFRLRTHPDYERDLDELIQLLREKLSHTPPRETPISEHRGRRSTSSHATAVPVDPPGLRAFTARDHDTYLRLVPGPRSRGLPLIVAHWKELVEEVQANRTFRIAYWYGPSGCGKSSLVNAGLLPVLSDYIIAVDVMAVGRGTEAVLLEGLWRAVTPLPRDLKLPEACGWIANNPNALCGRKVFVVLDQFEQWLVAAGGQYSGELLEALRACDGSHLQALLLVRDDFKTATHRLMTQIGVTGREGMNYELIDLLDCDFAKDVLFEYGRAYRAQRAEWPDQPGSLTRDQNQFLQTVVESLRNKDRRVAPVQLALLAQMLKDRPWTTATLDELGGVAGIGEKFLEEKFDRRSASGAAKEHRVAAIHLLTKLLPDVSVNIKGSVRSRDELIEAAGYRQAPEKFEQLIELLDNDLRLITPASDESGAGFQLSHDYLAESLGQWLNRKLPETRRGRAEQRLKELTELWTLGKRRDRQLPSLIEYLNIVRLVPPQSRDDIQNEMLGRALRVGGKRVSGVAVLLLVLVCAVGLIVRQFASESRQRLEFEQRIELAINDPREIGDFLKDRETLLESRHANWAHAYLQHKIDAPSTPAGEQLVAKCLEAMLPSTTNGHSGRRVKSNPFALLAEEIAIVTGRNHVCSDNFRVLCRVAAQYANERDARDVVAKLAALYQSLEEQQHASVNELEKTAALALSQARALAAVRESSVESRDLLEFLSLCQQRKTPGAQSKIHDQQQIRDELRQSRIRFGQWGAAIAAAMLRMNRLDEAMRLLSGDPSHEVRGQLIGLCECAVAPNQIADLLNQFGTDEKPAIAERLTLLSILARPNPEKLVDAERRKSLIPILRAWFEHDPSSAIHSLTGLLLRQWSEDVTDIERRRAVDQPPADCAGVEWFVLKVNLPAMLGDSSGIPGLTDGVPRASLPKPQLLLTFIVFDPMSAPGKFAMGSPASEFHRDYKREAQHDVRLSRRFAVCDRELACLTLSRPLTMKWQQAAKVCNSLTMLLVGKAGSECFVDNEGELAPPPDYQKRRGFRLLTDAEFEYACRSGSPTPYWFGTDDTLLALVTLERTGDNEGIGPPAQRLPNPRGLFDMHGNAGEWCVDRYVEIIPVDDDGESEDPLHFKDVQKNKGSRLVRGGWGGDGAARSASRHWDGMADPYALRLAITLDPCE